jgi:hypothetical protein
MAQVPDLKVKIDAVPTWTPATLGSILAEIMTRGVVVETSRGETFKVRLAENNEVIAAVASPAIPSNW